MTRTERLRQAIARLLPKQPPMGGIVTIERGDWRIRVNVGDVDVFVQGFGRLDPQSMAFEQAGRQMGRLGVDVPGTVHGADELLALLEGPERRAA